MKYLAYLLVTFTLVLSSSPCCTGDECCNETDKRCSDTNPEGRNSETPANTCSPFMVCGSCSGFVVIAVNLNVDAEPEIANTPNTPYIQSYLGNYNLEFWQPPKIS